MVYYYGLFVELKDVHIINYIKVSDLAKNTAEIVWVLSSPS